MSIELTRSDLLRSVNDTRVKLEEIEEINSKIKEIYTEPINDTQKSVIGTIINLAWLIGTFVVAFNISNYHFLLMPLYVAAAVTFRGSVIIDRISKGLYKKQLDNMEEEIERLYDQKSEAEYELNSMSMLDEEFRNVDMLRKFEGYIKGKKALTIEKCKLLYQSENKKRA